ncbi:hypothetical protein MK489_13290 [Myxococcota bacterium]|nr:hypothetical protein [Myxococcota bacterium]
MIAKIPTVTLATSLLCLACTAPPESGPAEACGSVVRYYRGLPSPVEALGNPLQTSTGEVEIRYRGTNGENLPVQGEASCEFSTGNEGALRLVAATIDGEVLGRAAVSAVNRAEFPQ